ncbi:unnamed protein product [Schistosoma margrebowiei]|uniref:Uncharacterized protein n=1 Tax=Schistosoma margrebowiei TaxID=48269 RepID=A0A183MY33_9TREM|nr:unnamed protein product [Schistosoma margrebowiei]
MVVGGSQQETLDPGFVLFGTRQQGVPVILRELVLPGGFDLSEKNRNDQKVPISSRSIQFMIAIFGIVSLTLVNITVIVKQFHPKWRDSPSSMILQTGITLFGFLIIIFLVVISQLNKTSEMLIEEENKHESIDKEVLARQETKDDTYILSV